jgi:hypothetical protein
MEDEDAERRMNRIKDIIRNKWLGYFIDLAIVFVGVAILSSGTGFVLDHRIFVLGVLLLVLLIRGIC